MYKLLIVDDEVTIIEGLCNIVDWKSMGFEVVNTAQDGREALDYINSMSVDVILTDIKMTFVSGLELAKYVADHKLGIKVVIMSGYKEFEFAREALVCNVKYYLLKPTRLDELRNVFRVIRDELDSERIHFEKIQNEQEQFDEMLSLYQGQFFTDLIMGAIRTKEAVDRRIKSRLEISPEISKVCVYTLCFKEEGTFDEKHLLETTMKNYMKGINANIKYFIVIDVENTMQVLAVAIKEIENDRIEEESLSFLERISEKIQSIIGISITIEHEKTFENLYEAAAWYKPMIPVQNPRSGKLEDVVDSVDLSHLLSQKKLFVSHIYSNNLEMAQNLFENFIDELKFMPIHIIHNFMIELFVGLKSKLEELGVNMQGNLFNYEAVVHVVEIDNIRLWGQAVLDDISGYVEQHKGTLNNSVIEKAKQYIEENYDKDIGLEEVSGHVFLSSIYFSHLFKQKTGGNFVDYLVKVRMNKAMELLKSQQYKIYEVSEKVGYKNTKYFYKLFKGFTGFTPAEYRDNSSREKALS